MWIEKLRIRGVGPFQEERTFKFERGCTVVTGEAGSFALPSLAVDTYTVTAILDGYQEQKVEDVRVGIGSAVRTWMSSGSMTASSEGSKPSAASPPC